MKVVLPEKKVFKKRDLVIYITIIAVCIISIVIAFYVQFYARINFGEWIGVQTEERYGTKTQEEVENLKAEFEEIFNNQIENEEGQENKKKEKEQPLVYTQVEKIENKADSYDINIHIPYLNINNSKIEEYNQEIEDVFVNKMNDVLESENKNILYTVDYVANVQYDILSLMIRSNLKEGASAQRVIIQTYNYDLRNNKEISLEEVLKIENMEQEKLQQEIRNEIKIEQDKVEDLKQLGYNIYNRDSTSDIYNIENSKQFYVTNDTLYIIYPYGNESFTSEMDLIII